MLCLLCLRCLDVLLCFVFMCLFVWLALFDLHASFVVFDVCYLFVLVMCLFRVSYLMLWCGLIGLFLVVFSVCVLLVNVCFCFAGVVCPS